MLRKCLISAFLAFCFGLPSFASPDNIVAMDSEKPVWLKNAIFYDIYPSSFKDSDGNGIGDLQGIISKLDYVKDLGVTAIWMNPIFVSGWFDGGYDIIDFYKVDPRFGTNEDVVTLVNEAHKRGLKVCLDLVAGHTSDQCSWFKESSSEKEGRYSDYYIWTDDISDEEKELIRKRHLSANPAVSLTGKYVEANGARAKYYRKNFYECQPALNYGFYKPSEPWQQSMDDPGPRAVKREMMNIIAFWFDKGIDGFRVDMASSLVKNDVDNQGTRKFWAEIRNWIDENYEDKVLISEWCYPTRAIPCGFNMDFYLPRTRNIGWTHLMWGDQEESFHGSWFCKDGGGECSQFLKKFRADYDATRDMGYISLSTSNHDLIRPCTEFRNGQDELKMVMTVILTMPGVPFIHYGDEIGIQFERDLGNVEGSRFRSGTRSPMQWDSSETCGFSTANPDKLYIPVNKDHSWNNVESQLNDPNSVLNYTKALIALRLSTPALGGNSDWEILGNMEREYPMVYSRSDGKRKYIIAVNPSGSKVSVNFAKQENDKPQPVISVGKASYKGGKNADTITLGGVSAVIYRVF